jgi:phosphoribosyl-AMP cyclohydrolase
MIDLAINKPDFSGEGNLVPAIAQDVENGDVLMMAYMNEQAFDETVATGRAVYWSRSRAQLWRKGELSGHVQEVVSIRVDCDADAVLLLVRQKGAACHEGFRSCFFRSVTPQGAELVCERLIDPKEVYGP